MEAALLHGAPRDLLEHRVHKNAVGRGVQLRRAALLRPQAVIQIKTEAALGQLLDLGGRELHRLAVKRPHALGREPPRRIISRAVQPLRRRAQSRLAPRCLQAAVRRLPRQVVPCRAREQRVGVPDRLGQREQLARAAQQIGLRPGLRAQEEPLFYAAEHTADGRKLPLQPPGGGRHDFDLLLLEHAALVIRQQPVRRGRGRELPLVRAEHE